MQYLLLLSLLSCALVLAAPGYKDVTDSKIAAPKKKLGEECKDDATTTCGEGLYCSPKRKGPKLSAGTCLLNPRGEGEDCGGTSGPFPPECKEGLDCVYPPSDPDKPLMTGGHGTCQRKEQFTQEGGTCAGMTIRARPCDSGLVCINKKPQDPSNNSKCFRKGEFTLANEGEACGSDIQSRCQKGKGRLECAPQEDGFGLCAKKY